jgi:hypothetical protein
LFNVFYQFFGDQKKQSAQQNSILVRADEPESSENPFYKYEVGRESAPGRSSTSIAGNPDGEGLATSIGYDRESGLAQIIEETDDEGEEDLSIEDEGTREEVEKNLSERQMSIKSVHSNFEESKA